MPLPKSLAGDSDTLIFLGEHPGEVSQVYSPGQDWDTQATDGPRHAIHTFDITANGDTLAFTTNPPRPRSQTTIKSLPANRRARAILYQILAGDYSQPKGLQVFWHEGRLNTPTVRVKRGFSPRRGISFYRATGGIWFSANSAGDRYRSEVGRLSDEFLQAILAANAPRGTQSSLWLYLLWGETISVRSLLDARCLVAVTLLE